MVVKSHPLCGNLMLPKHIDIFLCIPGGKSDKLCLLMATIMLIGVQFSVTMHLDISGAFSLVWFVGLLYMSLELVMFCIMSMMPSVPLLPMNLHFTNPIINICLHLRPDSLNFLIMLAFLMRMQSSNMAKFLKSSDLRLTFKICQFLFQKWPDQSLSMQSVILFLIHPFLITRLPGPGCASLDMLTGL